MTSYTDRREGGLVRNGYQLAAAKAHMDATKAWIDARNASSEERPGEDVVDAYNRLQGTQQDLLAAHNGDAGEAQKTLQYLNRRASMSKGL
jgi:hypothetical protein